MLVDMELGLATFADLASGVSPQERMRQLIEEAKLVAEVDLISGGRAEIMAGRGSFIESFPLFGQDLDDYDDLYAEKLDLLLKLREDPYVQWSGRHRPALGEHAGVWPRPVQDPLP